MNKNYVPYGPEWKKEMTKLPKSYIIELFRHKVRELEIELKSAKKASSLFASK